MPCDLILTEIQGAGEFLKKKYPSSPEQLLSAGGLINRCETGSHGHEDEAAITEEGKESAWVPYDTLSQTDHLWPPDFTGM
jgi:hypothetical protein